MNMKNIRTTKFFCFLFVLLLPAGHIIAQHIPGPYSYQPPEGINRWMDSSTSKFAYKTITMNQLSALATNEDGLMVAFDFDMDLQAEGKPIIAFSDKGVTGDNILEITYSERTVTVRRYNTIKGQRIYYDYHLFDPVFEDIGTEQSATWRMSFYFTSNFIYIVATIKGSEIRNLMSPLYFGLDYQKWYPDSGSSMYKFINRDSNAVLKIGDEKSAYAPYIANTKINSIIYGDWWFTIQKEFSSPNPPTLDGLRNYSTDDYLEDLY
jgi:hypothetical protein